MSLFIIEDLAVATLHRAEPAMNTLSLKFSSQLTSWTLIHGYNLIRKDRNRHSGGVAIYVSSSIPIKASGGRLLYTLSVQLVVH